MARVLLTIDEPICRPDGCMAGLQVRVHEMANALVRAGQDVVVAVPAVGAAAPGACYRTVALRDVGQRRPLDAWITHPRLVAGLEAALPDVPLIVDGYESPFGSFLAQAAALLPRLGTRVIADYRATIVGMLAAVARADRVLCATESQRVSYLTLLAALGRIGPRDPGGDLVLRVCSGVPPLTAPGAPRPAGAPVLLWSGGCYPWFDVETPLAAFPHIVAQVPDVRLLLAGVGGVDDANASEPLAGARRIREAIAADPRLAARTTILPWLPYTRRGEAYAAADLALCTYGADLETDLAMRTRVLDLLWGGVPMIVSAGDELGHAAASHGAGRVVPPGDPAALATAVVDLLRDAEARTAMAAAARAVASGPLSWDHQIVPLAAYCAALAAGTPRAARVVAPADAIMRLNDGWPRRAADAAATLARRLQNGLRRARRALGAGDGAPRVRVARSGRA